MTTLFNQTEDTQEIDFAFIRSTPDERTVEVTYAVGTHVLINVIGPYTVFLGETDDAGKSGFPVNCKEPMITAISSPFYINSPYGSAKVLVTPGEVV